MLDAEPYGLGWVVHPTVHTFSALKVYPPRLELERRNQYVEARKLHYDHAATNGLARDSARLCLEDVVPLIRRPGSPLFSTWRKSYRAGQVGPQGAR